MNSIIDEATGERICYIKGTVLPDIFKDEKTIKPQPKLIIDKRGRKPKAEA